MADKNALKQIIQKIKDNSNILVTVNTNPSVDELSAALAITLCINKLNKHATAVFSGNVPTAIDFLNPEKTFEDTVNSLRDFIIALDKEKADHLRYKVVDDMVKIFITPYRTKIDESDLDFSQGDYNVEFVLAIGVKSEEDLDRALESHGRILHDATVATFSLDGASQLKGIEHTDSQASSYSEMLFQVADGLKSDKSLFDEQIANAFLTGIVAATDRFSNDKTSARVMTISAELLASGANQQLVASKLEDESVVSKNDSTSDSSIDDKPSSRETISELEQKATPKKEDGSVGTLSIQHGHKGTLDEVTKQVGEENSQQALVKAEDVLANHSKHEKTADKDRAEDAEKNLADQLASATVPSVTDIQNDLSKISTDTGTAESHGVEPARARTEEKVDEPTLGGTLNATTEQAEADKRRQIADDRNRTILSHGTYTSTAPAYQSPINATAAIENDNEPRVRDIFAESPSAKLENFVDTSKPPIPPPLPSETAKQEITANELIESAGINPDKPTLAEIDAKHRAPGGDDARAAIEAAFKGQTDNALQAEIANQQTDGQVPLPPLPPMPDFSTLPPLPADGNQSHLNNATLAPDSLGETLPPAPAIQPVTSNDPAQFHIPNQD